MYQALYRKYRPASFDDVISQEHITGTLKKEIISGKTAHAYIFTGSRGTGKTTCARILAKALLCENSHDGEPCLECEICRDMENGRLSDVIEIDAASNGSVSDARDLREAASYTPERCRYRIYIIDEVHMLSPDAFNALLKIIEEPPPHIKFIMATTEIHKVLPTVLSRCQRFDFGRIRPADIADRLMYVAEKEGLSVEREAAELIARASDGGMRDALSLLDRCVAYADSVTAETVSEAAGLAGNETVMALTEALAAKDAAKALEVISDAYGKSKDMAQLFNETIGRLRDILIILNVDDPGRLLNCMPDEIERLKKMAADTDEKQVIFALDELGGRTERFARVPNKRTELEMAAIRICKGASAQKAAAPDSALTAKIAELENKINAMKAAGYSAPAQPTRPEPRSQYNKERMVPKEAVTDLSGINKSEVRPFIQWADILEKFGEICPAMNGTLHGSEAFESGDTLLIVTENKFFLQLLRVKENALLLRKTICDVTGKNYHLRAKCSAPDEVQTGNDGGGLDALLKKAAAGNIRVDNE